MTDSENPKSSLAGMSRQLIRSLDRSVLSTTLAEGGGPYGSLVMTACDLRGAPLLLISDLAEHTRNLMNDERASLLFDGTAGLENPLTGARVSVVGRLVRSDDSALLERYVRRHPVAEDYKDFGDFHLYTMAVERAHLVAGFGTIHWVGSEELLLAAGETADLAAAHADIVDHMNADHGDAVALYGTKLLGLPAGPWRMTGIDPEGIDLRLNAVVGRVDFDHLVLSAAAARAELVRLVDAARGA